MAIQVGTVDGLVNISEHPIKCFVNAIDKFSVDGVSFARTKNVSLGMAFQRFVEPVYTNTSSVFKVNSILQPALTSSGNEQSPARVTYCKKMGLLEIVESDDNFRLTPLGELVRDNEISVSEYAFILLSKMGIFVNGELVDNLFCSLARYFKEHATISDEEYQSYVISYYGDDTILKTRFDIIVGALCVSGLVKKVAKNVYVLSSTLDAKIFEETLKYEMQLKSAFLDNDSRYAEFVGNLRSGIFSILNEQNIDVYTLRFGNLRKYIDDSNGPTSIEEIGFAKNHKGFDLVDGLDSLQQIFYGAPGTGKSHTINEVTKGENVIRTTFHPDSDYSSFVGAYKPTMGLLPICDELGQPMTIGSTVLHKEQVVYEFVEQAFLQAYVNAWKNRQVGSLIIDNGNYALSGMNEDVVYWRNCNAKPESKEGNTAKKEAIQKYYDGIAPEDTKTNAQKVIASYLKGLDSDFEKAWIKLKARLSTVTPQFLVIEEINRGNCAQIFGDIFQLLDRNDYGFSVYPINADKDMKKHLEKAFKDVSIDNADIINQQYKGRDVVKEVLNGDILLLPDNLYIWATMNTSDQSLFPIDSAFKRRWDWKYVPIEQPEEGAEGEPRKWKIKADGHWCYWWEFLQAINEEIEEVTHSEDKQLGYFFAKPQEGEYIDAKTFVSKVVFYLWNDVFKDENSEIFRYKKLEGKWDVDMPAPKRDNLYFRSFVKGREDVDEKMVRWFVNNLLKEHNVVLLDDGHQNPVTTDDISKEENIAWMRPYKEESPADADGTEDAIDGNNVNSPNGEDQPTDQVKNVVG